MRWWRLRKDGVMQVTSKTLEISDEKQPGCTLFVYESDVCDVVVKEHMQDEREEGSYHYICQAKYGTYPILHV